ncbi:MAG TPA: lysylphosphatidylglycerol synthase domain-containing protein [Acidimicrobiales bacterium]|nr:lysylphosphatidylglycerol synthase domain-containing protein [Acidimicrobiales bacterium]
MSRLSRLGERGTARSPRAQRLLLGAALAVFVVSGVLAIRALDGIPLADDWYLWLLVAAGLSLVTFGVNAAEFAVSALFLGVRPGVADSLRVSILASAANVMPIPGAALVRTQALKRLGLGYRQALSATAVIGLAWVATGALVAGALLVPSAQALVGGLALAAGVVGWGVAVILLLRQVGTAGTRRALPRVAAVEMASVAVGIARTWVVLRALGFDAGLAEAAALLGAAIVASAAGIFPGGIGIREVLSAAVGAVVGLPAAAGALMAAVDRIVGYAVLALCSAVVLATTGRPDTGDAGDADPGVPGPGPGAKIP